MACCIAGAFLISQLAVFWRWLGTLARGLSVGLASFGAVLVLFGVSEFQRSSAVTLLLPLCSPGDATSSGTSASAPPTISIIAQKGTP